ITRGIRAREAAEEKPDARPDRGAWTSLARSRTNDRTGCSAERRAAERVRRGRIRRHLLRARSEPVLRVFAAGDVVCAELIEVLRGSRLGHDRGPGWHVDAAGQRERAS